MSTVNVPLAVELSPERAELVACTVKEGEPAGVPEVVVIVRVEIFEVSDVPKTREAGLKEALAPAGRAVVRVRFAVKPVPTPVGPLRFTVIWYVALPAVPNVNVPVWPPTVTVPTRLVTTKVPVVV